MSKMLGAASGLILLVVAGGLWGGSRGAGGEAGEEPYPHEYAPIELRSLQEELADEPEILEKTLALEDFSGVSLDGREVDAQRLVEEHPVVLFTYLAEWCRNCRYEAPHLARLYWKYADRGFRVVARSEYSHPDVVKEMAGEFGTPYPIILGSLNPNPDDEDAVRTTTHHFALRKALDDPRKWGTPFNLIVVSGDVDGVHMVMGEFIPEELEAFLDEHLPEAEPATGTQEEMAVTVGG